MWVTVGLYLSLSGRVGLMRPCGALPSLPLGLSAEVTLAGVSSALSGCALPLRSRVSRGGPRPARTPQAGPPPLPASSPRFPSLGRYAPSFRSRPTLRYGLRSLRSLRGERSPTAGAAAKTPPRRFALRPGGRYAPFLAAAPASGLFQPRSAQPCVSPRLAVHFVHSRTFRCSRPRVPLATASLLSGCAVCQKLVLLSLAFCVLPRFACHLPPCSGNLCPIGHFRCSSGVSGGLRVYPVPSGFALGLYRLIPSYQLGLCPNPRPCGLLKSQNRGLRPLKPRNQGLRPRTPGGVYASLAGSLFLGGLAAAALLSPSGLLM